LEIYVALLQERLLEIYVALLQESNSRSCTETIIELNGH